MQSDREFGMASSLALIYAHKKCTVIDREALSQLEIRLKEERKKLTTESAYYASIFLLLTGNIEKARDYVEKSLKFSPNSFESQILKGWIDIALGTVNETTIELFNKALVIGKNLDAHLGQIRYYQVKNNFEAATSILNHLSIRYQELNIPLIEKMKTQLANWNWEYCIETCDRILNLEPNNLEALRIKALYSICYKGNNDEGFKIMQKLYSALLSAEPMNSELFMIIGQLFSRVCGRNQQILSSAKMFIDQASKIMPENSEYLSELGYETFLMGKIQDALQYYRSATKLDDSSITALCGLTLCQLTESGASEQVKQQIEFLNEIQGTMKTPLLLYMSAKIFQNDVDKSIALLIEACEIHLKYLKTIFYGIEYLRLFNADFLLQITHELIQYSPIQMMINADQNISRETLHASLKHSLNILEMIVKACPGNVEAVYCLAKVQFLSGEIDIAITTLQNILGEIDEGHLESHLLLAQINIKQERYQRATQNLDTCLSHNFSVREKPMYHILYGIILKHDLKYDDALKSFQTAMKMLGITKTSTNVAKLQNITNSDKLTLYLQVIHLYMIMNEQSNATKLMEQIIDEFSNTPEEGRVVIANSDLLLQQGNADKALELLKSITSDQFYYVQAKTKMANIYLNVKKDRVTYVKCFKELSFEFPGTESYLVLGDCFMSIQGNHFFFF